MCFLFNVYFTISQFVTYLLINNGMYIFFFIFFSPEFILPGIIMECILTLLLYEISGTFATFLQHSNPNPVSSRCTLKLKMSIQLIYPHFIIEIYLKYDFEYTKRKQMIYYLSGLCGFKLGISTSRILLNMQFKLKQ